MTTIDLRSDTVTRPTEAMRRAMASAEVGDDVYGEDPTVRRLEERCAELFGKEAALFMPSGTMANQIALMIHCRPGDEVIVGEGAHCFFYEGGAGAAWAGVQFVEVGEGGLFDAAAMEAAIKPEAYYLSRTRLVAIENTHNRAGGLVFPQDAFTKIAERARAHEMRVHLDGARIWNASSASGKPLRELATPTDTISACFSKGLGAPVGSILAGSKADMAHGKRLRRMMGGAMRQAGVIAAAAHYALDHHVARMADDHANARRLAEGLGALPGVVPRKPETNIVVFDVPGDADVFCKKAQERGVLMSSISKHRVRAVTHLDVDRAAIERALSALAS